MRVRLTGGAYQARAIIAAAQRQVNLYAEKGLDGAVIDLGGEPAPLPALYPTPGLTPLASPSTPGPARCLYWATSETLFYVCGNAVYLVGSGWTLTQVGTLYTSSGLVSMADNGTTIVIVDGSSIGYQCSVTGSGFCAISSAVNSPPSPSVYAFYGANRVAVVDGYLLFNQPGTRFWYCTYSGQVVFDSLYIAGKNGYSDELVAVVAIQRIIWLIGKRTTELWSNVGAADFPFAILPGPFIQHGCEAVGSIAQAQESIYWLSQDQSGAHVLVRSQGYTVSRISTHALEAEWRGYATVADAVGSCWQQNGHQFYQIDFPSADASFRFDEMTGEWHQAAWSDTNGVLHRHRAGCTAYAYGVNVCADWQTGQLYAIDPTNFTDAGAPIVRIRGFPHMVADGRRVTYRALMLDMQAGTSAGTSAPITGLVEGFTSDFSSDFVAASANNAASVYPLSATTPPCVNLRWSDDRGRTWGQPLTAPIGATGDYLATVKFTRLGMARDKVFEVSWDAPIDTGLQGAWITLEPADS